MTDNENRLQKDTLALINRQKAEIERLEGNLKFVRGTADRQLVEIERLTAFKSYFDELYGTGLEVANWHQNGDMEAFDNFYDAAIKEMEG